MGHIRQIQVGKTSRDHAQSLGEFLGSMITKGHSRNGPRLLRKGWIPRCP